MRSRCSRTDHSEKEHADHCSQAEDHIDGSRSPGLNPDGTTENRFDQVKVEKADKPPIESADDQESLYEESERRHVFTAWLKFAIN
jgi:hypothetical protein